MLTRNNEKLMFDDKFYSFAKKLVQVFLPAISSLYFGLDAIWDLPSEDKVVGTLAVIATFIGVCLGISSRQYESSGAAYDGNMIVVSNTDETKTFSLELNDDPDLLEKKDAITFKVQREPEKV